MEEVPHEILAVVFEIGILTWDIRFLPPLRLVCRSWNDIVMTTPRLWGLITVDKGSNLTRLKAQILKAKNSPLTITARRTTVRRHQKALQMLVDLSSNWVYLDATTAMLRPGRWSNLRGTLETLRLITCGSPRDGQAAAEEFFDTRGPVHQEPPRLRSFAAHNLSDSWLLPFLSSSITSFELHAHHSIRVGLLATLIYLSKIPRVSSLLLHGVQYLDDHAPVDIQRPLHLKRLTTLEVDCVQHPATILGEIIAPSLQTLVVKNSHIGPSLIVWSQPKSGLPTLLRSLTLSNCLEIRDVAFLIRWLARLPSLTHLALHDDAIARAAELPPFDEETNLFAALASPEGAGTVGGWLCPSLTRIQLSMDLQIMDLLPLSRARGSRSMTLGSNTPSSLLHYLGAPMCPNGRPEEIEELKGLFDEALCECFACQFNLTSMSFYVKL
ncbi:hypothetical protein DXG01_011309 [Tephrocybe rancida]|nr:hypothetical protein DXG01_011309 [Tephrocybe rancida]